MSGGRTASAVLIALLGGSGFAGAASHPDLVESAVAVSQQGRTLRVTDVVRNNGGTVAPPSVTRYFLARMQVGSRRVDRLRPAAASRSSKTLAIPSSVPPGSWRLLACADAHRRIPESNERNNCHAASRRVEVGDTTPPRFAGVTRATTCIPGPVGGPVIYSRYNLRWDAATDNGT